MPIFTYKAKDTKGETIQGSMEADTQAIVINRLQSMGFFPLMVQADLSAKKKTSGLNRIFRARIKNTDLTSFNRQLSDLISAGIPLVKALTIIVNQTANESLREIVATVSSDVQGGDTLAAALSKHPAVFSKLYCAMVKAGETGGMLDAILERLAEFSETEDEIKSKIKSAMAYPAIMLVAGMGAIVILTTVVIPKIMAIFKDLNQALPGITQLLINIIDFFSSYWYMIIGGGIVGGIVIYKFLHTDEGKTYWHTLQIKIPMVGNVIVKREVARFARTLGSLLKNGVSILSSLEITREVMANKLVQAEIIKVSENITQGSGIAAPLKGSKIFPSVVVNMVAIGEETGRLHDVLLRIASSYELQVDRSIKTLTSLIEPLIILLMGAVVGFVVIAMLLPIFTIDPTKDTGM
ncbi:MAG TPA: type II secretion system F family protein [Candidatus Sumerlaeota bacterium]|nr:type II secretion system F family protein [Candidatus Sumerlaeota bacterium]HON49821.1 type II secretion system F family protein [Candidatus Sumerlaeota bacterium]HOR63931.1 type II secretion system F family protein [Candidatus Sumerlaeota bacterium]HPL75079.1 type II secretion system F family protein [Candidatus Sumerlaeota bacterium]HRU53694.1 type II secretion system F family protein [Candidatus Sumerlaeia bacterium]